MKTSNYWVNCADSENPSRWMRFAKSVRMSGQDSGRCSYTAEVAPEQIAAFEAELERDSGVLEYSEVA